MLYFAAKGVAHTAPPQWLRLSERQNQPLNVASLLFNERTKEKSKGRREGNNARRWTHPAQLCLCPYANGVELHSLGSTPPIGEPEASAPGGLVSVGFISAERMTES